MLRFAPRSRLLGRLRAPLDPAEVRRTERWLASARVFLAITALVTSWVAPLEGAHSRWFYWLLIVYIVHGVTVMLLLRFRRESTPAFRVLVHAFDVIWPALLSLFVAGEQGPIFLLFVFVITAAAYRWGLWETLFTALSAVLLLWLQAAVLHGGGAAALASLSQRWGLPPPGFALGALAPHRLLLSAISLLILGLLLGYLAEQQKTLRAERAMIARVLGAIRVEKGLTGAFQGIMEEVVKMYGARRILCAWQETNSYRVFLSEVQASGAEVSRLQWLEVPPEARSAYLEASPADACFVARSKGGLDLVALDSTGEVVRNVAAGYFDRMAGLQEFQSAIVLSYQVGTEWSGRIFVFDPRLSGDPVEELRFLQEFLRQIGPAVSNVYLLHRLRQRAGATERARFARELHDGAIQSLIGVELQLDVLRRQNPSDTTPVNSELGRIQGLLREEVLKLRQLMQELKSFEVDSARLPAFLAATVERFQRETGISARFLTDLTRVDLPRRVCGEVARIAQEALVNIRKHSGAHQVLVRLGARNGSVHLVVEDDGRGFPFSGHLSQADLSGSGKAPSVILERVRLIEGELAIESTPGQGARIEVRVPLARVSSHG